MKPTSKNKQVNSKDYENLGRAMSHIYESGYLDVRKSLRLTFYKGFLGGFAGVLGATIGVAILIWILSLFDEIPLIGEFITKINETITP